MALENINTIVLLMFENRSFDHMLGHLSYDNINKGVNGLTKPLTQYSIPYKGDDYSPWKIKTDANMAYDIPHEFSDISIQMAKSAANGKYEMDGFVQAYLDKSGDSPNKFSPPLGFFKQEQVPVTSFLANTYSVCDNWFAPMPTSTQPNRTMAFCGDSSIHQTKLQLVKADGNIFDWMNANGVKWRVYHDGLSFFILYDHLWTELLSDRFRDYESLFHDVTTEADETFPQVIVVEPSYHDAPHFGSDQPNDNHAPLAVGFGEEFLRRTYEAITANQKRWGNTLMVVYYDEHGGFFDHVPPPAIPYDTKEDSPFHFNSLGVRIPGILVSPYVAKNSVCSSLFDHTSVLQLLAEKFTPGKPYSATVADRKNKGIESLSTALSAEADPAAPPPPQQIITVKSMLGDNIATAPSGDMGQAFENAAQQLITREPAGTADKYPELFQWKNSVDKSRG
ncbi:MAG: alkaline phosphatase family protein [Bacteroidota bacterium]